MSTGRGTKTFSPSPDVFTAELDGVLIALDVQRGAYYAFDEVATAMWEALVTLGSRDRALERIAALYDADPREIERDLDALIARLVGGGFARWALARDDRTAMSRPPARRGARRPSTARAWWWLARTVLGLRRDGFGAAYRRTVALGGVEPVLAQTRDALVERALRAFARAENLFVMKTAPRDCLPRSMALFCFLRELGIPVEHRIGVDRFPFRAHAWVEYDGRVLADHGGNREVFTTIALIPG